MKTFGYVSGAFEGFRNFMTEITTVSEQYNGDSPVVFAFEFSWLAPVVYSQRSELSNNPGSRMRQICGNKHKQYHNKKSYNTDNQ